MTIKELVNQALKEQIVKTIKKPSELKKGDIVQLIEYGPEYQSVLLSPDILPSTEFRKVRVCVVVSIEDFDEDTFAVLIQERLKKNPNPYDPTEYPEQHPYGARMIYFKK